MPVTFTYGRLVKITTADLFFEEEEIEFYKYKNKYGKF